MAARSRVDSMVDGLARAAARTEIAIRRLMEEMDGWRRTRVAKENQGDPPSAEGGSLARGA